MSECLNLNVKKNSFCLSVRLLILIYNRRDLWPHRYVIFHDQSSYNHRFRLSLILFAHIERFLERQAPLVHVFGVQDLDRQTVYYILSLSSTRLTLF